MKRPVLNSTAQLLGDGFQNCENRSLMMDRFAHPAAKDSERLQWLERLVSIKAPTAHTKRSWWPRQTVVLKAQLQSRLLIDMAGGVMENAGISMDRFGMPRIRGSAVKGCARHAVLRFLNQWATSGERPPLHDPEAVVPSGFAGAFHRAVRVFGAVKEDFAPDKDWAWAAADMAEVLGEAKTTASGTVAFLEATPYSAPAPPEGLPIPSIGTMEIDVLTSHHMAYYAGKSPVALDNENPIPVNFPAVAAGHLFRFPLLPLRRADKADAAFARVFLGMGLEAFGIGAKTAAGYGWFRVLTAEDEAAAPQQVGDYPSEKAFQGAVLEVLPKAQEANKLKAEIEKLKKPENEPWRQKLTQHLASPGMKDVRNRLKNKDWFPRDWFPTG